MQILALWLDGYNDLYTRAAGTNDCRPFATEVVAFFGACIIHELSLWTYQHQSIRPSTALENTASADEEVGIVLKKINDMFFQIRSLTFLQRCSITPLSNVQHNAK